MENDPLDDVFETPEQSLAHYLNAMPKSLVPVFRREFMRRPIKGAVDAPKRCFCGGFATINDTWCEACFPDTGRRKQLGGHPARGEP